MTDKFIDVRFLKIYMQMIHYLYIYLKAQIIQLHHKPSVINIDSWYSIMLGL